eukprot:gnl/TRDRNA2_/TRDRNA2_139938_c1_seq1.p1 gnl/TRDRNA2_/TRDRNA2_139938_c1~~gnl/TRDRNA2_/TRDRNA2_139938_c1_seq1.p1  ORF type:complete len:217 (-),score=20.64 gnl/TRDRNA2_/TRDRNA2_139938_c1_seq1:29-679(-)
MCCIVLLGCSSKQAMKQTSTRLLTKVRLQVKFAYEVSLANVSDVRILAPGAWDLRPLCILYKDETGGDDRVDQQLPYSEERGHHKCPQAHVLLLLLNQEMVIHPRVYTLLVGARNPDVQPIRNFWTVSLLSPATNLGWTPEISEQEAFYQNGMRPGQHVIAESAAFGFAVGERLSFTTPPPIPLQGEFFEVLSTCSPMCHSGVGVVAALVLAIVTA